jgi:hypothetical protein
LNHSLAPVLDGNGIVLTWRAIPGKIYRVLYKESLSDVEWTVAQGTVSIIGTHASFIGAIDQSVRHYGVESE